MFDMVKHKAQEEVLETFKHHCKCNESLSPEFWKCGNSTTRKGNPAEDTFTKIVFAAVKPNRIALFKGTRCLKKKTLNM